MIERVTFHRFKQFADRTLELHPGVSLLGGGNNAGKSTILHGLGASCQTSSALCKRSSTAPEGVPLPSPLLRPHAVDARLG
jgi:AAA15 family ATPase/GTPase